MGAGDGSRESSPGDRQRPAGNSSPQTPDRLRASTAKPFTYGEILMRVRRACTSDLRPGRRPGLRLDSVMEFVVDRLAQLYRVLIHSLATRGTL